MEVLRPFKYRILSMSNSHMVTFCRVITIYKDMLDHMYGVMGAIAEKMTRSMEDMYFAAKLA